MTDKEMAKEYVDTLLNKDDSELDKFLDENLGDLKLTKKQAGTLLGIIKGIGISSFLAGLKAGRPKWHKVADGDLPTKELEEKQLLVRIRNYTEDYIFAYYMLDKYYSKNGKRFYSDTDCDYPIDIEDIIAWKEIVLPEEEVENESHT